MLPLGAHVIRLPGSILDLHVAANALLPNRKVMLRSSDNGSMAHHMLTRTWMIQMMIHLHTFTIIYQSFANPARIPKMSPGESDVAMENSPVKIILPFNFPILRGFSIAMFDSRRVSGTLPNSP